MTWSSLVWKSVIVTGQKYYHHPPSVSVKATINNEKGGRWSLAFNVAKTADKITYGATILNICGKPSKAFCMEGNKLKNPTRRAAIKNGLKIGTRR
jgi:hypothetical protein